ncbi:thiamin biosynthesis protein [Paractinoplanes deccanensis]|uniref:Thiamin biosynthesis protein n=1 Tax=Paractinoplanes deccanensis TaxID=113561 RepID=A0ABQ3Y8Y8_9ACTN|nr:hypothetical protein [Actinoplanes deccanensis]GID76461.1 thiamin biosynthesis protein [Actinoplanes deccanensis]
MNRPLLLPGLPRVWRDDTELQLGADPAGAVLLRLPDPRAAEILDLMDGRRPERLVLLRAVEMGIPAAEARALMESLRVAGLAVPATTLIPRTAEGVVQQRLVSEAAALAFRDRRDVPAAWRATRGEDRGHRFRRRATPATTLRRRRTACVVVAGHGRLGASIAVALAEAGVGHVAPEMPGTVTKDELVGGPLRAGAEGLPRNDAIDAAIAAVAPGVIRRRLRTMRPTLVVQLDNDKPAPLLAAVHGGRRQAHLAVTIREGTAVIGPLVPPTGGPCLGCLHLHRLDRDARWPGPPRTDVPEPCTVTTLLAATGYATAQALAYLDGDIPETLGASVEITSAGSFRRRTWPPHPHCDCTRRRPRPAASKQPTRKAIQAGERRPASS